MVALSVVSNDSIDAKIMHTLRTRLVTRVYRIIRGMALGCVVNRWAERNG